MTTSFINEITDQELHLVDLHDMNGGLIGILLLLACEDDDEESSSQTTSTTSSSTSGTQSTGTTSSTTWLNWMEKATVGNKYHPSINPNGKKWRVPIFTSFWLPRHERGCLLPKSLCWQDHSTAWWWSSPKPLIREMVCSSGGNASTTPSNQWLTTNSPLISFKPSLVVVFLQN